MVVRGWLIDKSAYARLSRATELDEWISRIERGLVRIAAVTKLEIGYSARSGDQARSEFTAPPLVLMPVEYLTPATEDRALEVQAELADLGRHRAPSVADLLIAATAERAGLTLLHVDKDFELIGTVTGQATEHLLWVQPEPTAAGYTPTGGVMGDERAKRVGMHWTIVQVPPMLALRVIDKSDRRGLADHPINMQAPSTSPHAPMPPQPRPAPPSPTWRRRRFECQRCMAD